MQRANCPTQIDEEKVLATLEKYPLRDQCLVVVGLETGLRLSELCRLSIGSVWRNGGCLSTLRVSRRHLKGGRGPRARSVRSREITLNKHAQEFLARHIREREETGPLWPSSPLFPGREGRRSLSRTQAWRIIRRMFMQAGCDPAKTWAGGSLRRALCGGFFEATNIEIARRCIQHASAITTALYIRSDEDVESAAEAIVALGRVHCTSRQPQELQMPKTPPSAAEIGKKRRCAQAARVESRRRPVHLRDSQMHDTLTPRRLT